MRPAVCDVTDDTLVLARRDGVIEYELRKYSDYATSPFAGDPRPELEEAWHDLFLCKTSIPTAVKTQGSLLQIPIFK
jgi:hypothetical protein